MVRKTVSESAEYIPAEVHGRTILLICCMIFSSVLYALPSEELSAKPADIENAAADVGLELEAILKKNTKCLRCHSKDKTKLLEDGEQMSLQIHPGDFTGSAHGEIGCVSCHEAIGNRKHPSKRTNITINNQRDYSVELNQSCRNCHDNKFTQYDGSIHASMVKQGSKKAPVCTSCHSAHAVETMADYQPVTGFPCKNCHENIFNSYTQSVHGEARINGNTIRDTHIQAPICADCHHAHDVTALAIGDTLRSTCIGCHENVILLHNQWLPNAGTHLDIVSCAVCHAPFAKRKFDLHLYDNVSQVPVAQQVGDESLQQQLQAIEKAGGSVDSLELLRAAGNRGRPGQGPSSDVSLRSRVEVRSGVAAHQIAAKSFAVRTCDSCHETDSRQRQDVTVSVPQPDGRIQSFEADREALRSVSAVDSISDFYALGGNPNKLLDILFVLSLASGIAIPVGHFTLGKMIKEKLERGEQ